MGSHIWLTINFLLLKENFYIGAIGAICAIYVLNQTRLKAEALYWVSVHRGCHLLVAERLNHRVVVQSPPYRRLA